MANKYLIIGAGKMGEAIAYDLLQNDMTSKVKVIDMDHAKLERFQESFADDRLSYDVEDASSIEKISAQMKDADVAIGAAVYRFNAILTKAAIDTNTHFCDLGGNNRIVADQFRMDDIAKKNGVKIVPDCGIAPGAVSIFSAYVIMLYGIPDSLKIRVGGIPQEPKGSLGYMNIFSIQGLVNEYKEKAEVLRSGKRMMVEPLTESERVIFVDDRLKEGKLILEAAITSGGSSTLARTFEDQIMSLDYKTLRYPGHWDKIRMLNEFGFFDEKSCKIGKSEIRPRDLTEMLLEKNLPRDGKDMMLVRITLQKAGKEMAMYDLVDLHDEKTGHTAMQRTTGYSASIIAQMLANDEISEYGTLYQEKSVPAAKFVTEFKKRGMELVKKS